MDNIIEAIFVLMRLYDNYPSDVLRLKLRDMACRYATQLSSKGISEFSGTMSYDVVRDYVS